MEYLDFVIRLESSDRGWTTRVLESPSGEGREALDLGIDPETWTRLWFSQADRVRRPRLVETADEVAGYPDISELPSVLFQALFTGETLRLWDRSVGHAAPGGVRLHLRFDARESALAPLLPLPWELAQDPLNESFYGPSSLTPILRYLEVARPRPGESLPRPLKILLVASQPDGVSPLKLNKEVEAIQDAFRGRESVRVDLLPRARLADLRDALRHALRAGDAFHVLHFMGHGDLDPVTGDGYLLFEDDNKKPRQISGNALATQLQDFRATLRLAVLNACHSGAQRGGQGRAPFAGVAAALVRAGLPAVVAMQLPISDAAAIAFADTFYLQVARGEPVEVAVALGRQAIRGVEPHTFEWAVPALFSRLRSGRLFEPEVLELPREERLRQILTQKGQRVSDQALEHAGREALRGHGLRGVEPILCRVFVEKETHSTLRAAQLIRQLRWFTPNLAELLADARPRDQAPWPVESALIAIARHDSDYLPHSRRSLRRVLARDSRLAARLQASGSWRRLAFAVYGGLAANGEVDPASFHHEASALTPWVVETLEADVSPEQRLPQLRSLSNQRSDSEDLLLARIALGDRLSLAEVQRVANALRRSKAILEAQSISLEEWLRTLRDLPEDSLAQILEWLPSGRALPTALLRIASSLPAEERLPWLVPFLRLLLRRDDPTALYNLAVVLDTQGDFLSSSPRLLARATTIAIRGQTQTALPQRHGWLCAFLDAIGELPESFGFFSGWLLISLLRQLQAVGLLPEALTLALQLSDRMGAREDTLERLVAGAAPGTFGELGAAWLRHRRPAVALAELATNVEDPWLRFRLYRRIVQAWPSQWTSLCQDRLGRHRVHLAPASAAAFTILQPDERKCALTDLIRLKGSEESAARSPSSLWQGNANDSIEHGQALLNLGVDHRCPGLSLVVLRALVADSLDQIQKPRNPLNSLQPVSRLGVAALHRIARKWLTHRENDPRNALRWRWRFEAVEHDDAEALELWASAVACGNESQASEAEAILGNIQALRSNLAGALRDLLCGGVPRVQKALLRSLTYLLARRRLQDSVWVHVAPALPSLADGNLLAGEHYVLDGPGAVVAAAGAVRQRLATENANISPVQAAERAYDRWRQPWKPALLQPSDTLRRTLTSIGEEWLVSDRSRQEIEEAGRRVALEPPVFDILLDWASEEMRRDVRKRDPDDYLLGDLLSVLAAAARRIPDHYRVRLPDLPIWERQLCEAARDADWFPARRAALELLKHQKDPSPRVRETFQDARNDISEVRNIIEELPDAP